MTKKNLREGFTTGTAASAAASAALWALYTQQELKLCSVALPPIKFISVEHSSLNSGYYDLDKQAHLDIPISYAHIKENSNKISAVAGVIKDGGDDPDVTHESLIEAEVFFLEGLDPSTFGAKSPAIELPLNIFLFAGEGVGIATLPGLPIKIGEAAINPEPRLQIAAAVDEMRQKFLNQKFFKLSASTIINKSLAPNKDLAANKALAVIIRVKNGEEIAQKTLNPRLGIVGGISILGTRGTVRPFSHEAWEEAVRLSLSVCKALNLEGVALCTGRRSEELIKLEYADWCDQAFIQAADYVASALKEAGKLGFKKIVWSCFWGKLVKLAQGMPNTHARSAPLDLSFLADEALRFSNCLSNRLSDKQLLADKIRNSNTAVQALAYIQEADESTRQHLIAFVGNLALNNAHAWVLQGRLEANSDLEANLEASSSLEQDKPSLPVDTQSVELYSFSSTGEQLFYAKKI